MRNITGQAVVGGDLYGRGYDSVPYDLQLFFQALRDECRDNPAALRTLEADGYIRREGDGVSFRSNLLRRWWQKHHAGDAS